MLNRQERIEKAIEQLPTKKAKDLFTKLAAEHPDMSIFWHVEDQTASLEDEEVGITIA